ncbi:hypothetical protein [Pseudarthrobacter enclensis]|uniref:Uncharacterized protein n=1 Tax=Pseudarthrobacter enclensis TaxID=993070 RepID=A0ABT9RZW3_9MICC|nr:hypothetical protein [Pseudarthrobacter enclensis]MDP9890776.1 hypothetical protein [Pseudarthrobacter enclensis]
MAKDLGQHSSSVDMESGGVLHATDAGPEEALEYIVASTAFSMGSGGEL